MMRRRSHRACALALCAAFAVASAPAHAKKKDDDIGGPGVPIPEPRWEMPRVSASIQHHDPDLFLFGSSAVKITLRDRADGEAGYRVYRSYESSGNYQLIRELGPQTYNDQVSFVDGEDGSLRHNARYCYRFEMLSNAGTTQRVHRCVITGVEGINPFITRAEIELHVGDVKDAGTDGSIAVRLNGYGGAPTGNKTWLNWGRNDFERGKSYRFDLNVFDLKTLSGITQVEISKKGNDGICLDGYTLHINGQEAVSEDLRVAPGVCRWFDPSGDHEKTVHRFDLRRIRDGGTIPDRAYDKSNWTTARSTLYSNESGRFPDVEWIFRKELEDRFESLIGDAIEGTDFRWEPHGRRAATVKIENAEAGRLYFNADLEYDGPGFINPDVDIEFDVQLGMRCVPDEDDPAQDPYGPNAELLLEAEISDMNAGVSDVWDVLAVVGMPIAQVFTCLFSDGCRGYDGPLSGWGPLEWLDDGWYFVDGQEKAFIRDYASLFFHQFNVPGICKAFGDLGWEPRVILTQDRADLELPSGELASFPDGDSGDFAVRFWRDRETSDRVRQALRAFFREVNPQALPLVGGPAPPRVFIPSGPILLDTAK